MTTIGAWMTTIGAWMTTSLNNRNTTKKQNSMTKFRIIAIGKLPSEYENLSKHFITMLGKNIEICELVSKKNTMDHEGTLILEKISKSDFTVILDIKGTKFSSEKFADFIAKTSQNNSSICFIIGGAFGLSDEVKSRANTTLSFSDMTFPHMLARVMLLEQIYRATAILQNHPYHK